MTSRAVHWQEGMFLRPLHFQAAQRYQIDLSRRNQKWDLHYNWGLRSIELDMKALANHRLVIRSLEARLRDGTLVVISEGENVPPVDLRNAFEEKDTRNFLIYLAVPSLYLGRRNVSLEQDRNYRFYQDSMDFEDENTGGNPQALAVRLLNVQFLIGNQDQKGYEVLPIARVERSNQAEAGLQIDITFIPPLLSCDAWKPLADGILRGMYERLAKKIDWLIQHMSGQGITFERQAPGDALLLRQLQQLNEAISVLGVLVSATGVHPLTAFLELSRMVGQMAIFGATRRPPDLPPYNHDDLGSCFFDMKRHLDAQLDIVVEPEYKERAFLGAGWRMQLALEPAWLEPSWQMYIGVQSSLEAGKLIDLLTQAGQLDMKVGSSDRVDDLFRKGSPGMRFVPVTLPPSGLPSVANQVYLQITSDVKDPEWLNVRKSLTLALRLNENLIVGNIQGQRRLTIKADGRNVAMQFSLYVLPGSRS